jgi:hypothetical protein
MLVTSGFGTLAELPWERITDKIERRMLAGTAFPFLCTVTPRPQLTINPARTH